MTDSCTPGASDFNPTWPGSPPFSPGLLQLLAAPSHVRGWPSKEPSEPYREVKQKPQRGLGGVGTAIPSPLSLQGARTDCKMPQGCGAREKGAEALHRVLTADAGGEGPLVGWLSGGSHGWLGHVIQFFPTVLPQIVICKGNGARRGADQIGRAHV